MWWSEYENRKNMFTDSIPKLKETNERQHEISGMRVGCLEIGLKTAGKKWSEYWGIFLSSIFFLFFTNHNLILKSKSRTSQADKCVWFLSKRQNRRFQNKDKQTFWIGSNVSIFILTCIVFEKISIKISCFLYRFILCFLGIFTLAMFGATATKPFWY